MSSSALVFHPQRLVLINFSRYLLCPPISHHPLGTAISTTKQELPNSTDANTIISKGVTHKSPFANEVYKLIFSPDDKGTASSYVKFDTNDCREHFWVSSFATASVTILNQERNNLAQFVRLAVECVVGNSDPGSKGVPKAELKAMFDSLPIDIFPRDQETVPSDGGEIDPYLHNCASLYAAVHFGRCHQECWKKFFMPIVVCVTKYRVKPNSRSLNPSPLSGKNIHNFSTAVNKIIREELQGKTVSSLLRKSKPALEALLRLQVVKYILSTIFKGHHDVLVNLLKGNSSLGDPPSVPNARMDNQAQFYRDYYIAPINYSSGLYSDLDISYFSQLRDQIHSTENNLDKKRSRPSDDDSSFILSFLPSDDAVSSPPPHNIHPGGPSSALSPSITAHGAMTIVEVDSDSD
jgi:hypothetical protein